MAINIEPKCQECHVNATRPTSWHVHTCSLRPRNQLLRQCEIYQQNATAYAIWETRMKDLIAKWQGKFLVVKNENNKLRRELYGNTQTKRTSETPVV